MHSSLSNKSSLDYNANYLSKSSLNSLNNGSTFSLLCTDIYGQIGLISSTLHTK